MPKKKADLLPPSPLAGVSEAVDALFAANPEDAFTLPEILEDLQRRDKLSTQMSPGAPVFQVGDRTYLALEWGQVSGRLVGLGVLGRIAVQYDKGEFYYFLK